jgi:adenylate cyclase
MSKRRQPTGQRSGVRGPRKPQTGRQSEIVRLRRELNEARQQQAASAEVLGVISSSPGELAPVFSAMLKSAVRTCGSHLGRGSTFSFTLPVTVEQQVGQP